MARHRSFYKHMLGLPAEVIDIEATEPDYYKSLKQILETPLDDLMLDLTFTSETNRFGHTEVRYRAMIYKCRRMTDVM
jgi:E3 ubiquitin-protein ligase HACE1